MRLTFFKNTVLITFLIFFSCGSQTNEKNKSKSAELEGLQKRVDILEAAKEKNREVENTGKIGKTRNDTLKIKNDIANDVASNLIFVGAEQPKRYLPILAGKTVGVVANQTSVIINSEMDTNNSVKMTHLVDFLLEKSISVKKVFAPEHGFRGTADAGESIKNSMDSRTGLPIISLYGKNKKPSAEQMKGLDVIVFDIQDVGVRFYTYISTLHYVMEACAEAKIPLLILDRPNPNGHYIDGPILESEFKSFVGMHPVPVVHGMTIGEYAQMINGQGWLTGKEKCELTVIPMKNYTHATHYSIPIKPSPNLPNDVAINLYPSLCFFEGTFISAGRGTDMQFQIFGAPSLPADRFPFLFKPQKNEGAQAPKFIGQLCQGKDLRDTPRLDKLNLEWLIEAYVANGKKKDFFTNYFTTLAGTKKLQQQIEQGFTYREIRKTWLKGLHDYDTMRMNYMIYE